MKAVRGCERTRPAIADDRGQLLRELIPEYRFDVAWQRLRHGRRKQRAIAEAPRRPIECQRLADPCDLRGGVLASVPAGIDVDLFKRHSRRNVELSLIRREIR